jgi:hypothetical protein
VTLFKDPPVAVRFNGETQDIPPREWLYHRERR